jgi:hypothetical protein
MARVVEHDVIGGRAGLVEADHLIRAAAEGHESPLLPVVVVLVAGKTERKRGF